MGVTPSRPIGIRKLGSLGVVVIPMVETRTDAYIFGSTGTETGAVIGSLDTDGKTNQNSKWDMS